MTSELHHAPAAIACPCMHRNCTAAAEVELYAKRGRLEGLFCQPHARQREMAAAASKERQQRRAGKRP